MADSDHTSRRGYRETPDMLACAILSHAHALHSVSLELKEHDEVLAGVVSQLALDIIYDANELITDINERHAEDMAAEGMGGDDD